MRCIVKSYLLTFIDFLVFDFEYVDEIIFSYGNLSLNRSISCDFKVGYSKGLNLANRIRVFNLEFVYIFILFF